LVPGVGVVHEIILTSIGWPSGMKLELFYK
jgi:hypothetical protein